MATHDEVLCWLHIGDLHIAAAGADNHRDLTKIVSALDGVRGIDFVLLPGDNADNGTEAQFRLVAAAIAPLDQPVHILPGDHDFEPRSLDAFHATLGAAKLPKAVVVHGRRCLFLDVVSAGTGGPDFRLDTEQLAWAEREVAGAEAKGEPVAVFMHTYPADLTEGAARLNALLARPSVVCVDMGHTHYNELANDGRTVFMATRSTGQIEEGPPGFSIAALDGDASRGDASRGGASWRFRPLATPWPAVLITRPIDRRLARDGVAPAAAILRAKVLGDAAIATVEYRVDDGAWTAMEAAPGEALWRSAAPVAGARIAVRAVDALGRRDEDRIEPVAAGATPPARHADGSDRDRLPAWPEKGLFDTQLGPNRNGRKW